VKLPYPTIGDALITAAGRHPGSPALIFPHQSRTLRYRDWLEIASRAAAGFRGLGVARGDHVALLAENRFEWPVVQAAVALLGAVLVPLNTHYRREDLQYVLEHSRARMLVLSRGIGSNDFLGNLAVIRGSLPDLDLVVTLDGGSEGHASFETLSAEAPMTGFPPVAATDVGSLQYTSGTTGFPKGALLTHQGMLHNALATARRLRLRDSDRWTSIIPLFHCAGCIMNVLGCLQTGACYVGIPRFDPVKLFTTIEAQACTVLSGVPTSYLAMLQHPERKRFDLSSLRAGTCGGADADPQVLRECARELPIPNLMQVYGQTEAGTLVSCPSVDDPARFDTAGPVLEGCEVRITDADDGRALQRGTIGQIEVRGPIVMRGYFDRPEATREALSGDGWLRTGDLGYLREDERLVIAGGRLRDLIIRGGENVYPVEVENCLRRHPAVEEVAVFGIADAYYGEIVAAAVRPRRSVPVSSLVEHCRSHIAGFKVPASWYRVTEYPMTSSGKIRKLELRELAAASRLETIALDAEVTPRTEGGPRHESA
jgi:acyl-CoA synthetase (AMP-forming)/AMP-acid ligase II